MKTFLVIPAHLGSKRLNKKLLINIHGLPILEHVRRRAILSNSFDKIFIVTPNIQIKKIIESYGGNVILSKRKHNSGTSRVSEIIKKFKCNKLVILFGDEILMDPKALKKFTNSVNRDKVSDVWNATSNKINKKEISEKSVVKCLINDHGYIKAFSREDNFAFGNFKKYKILKSVGILAYKKKSLLKLKSIKSSKLEKLEKIEQIKVLENSLSLKSVLVNFNYPAVNTKKELKICLNLLKKDNYQRRILYKILKL